MIHKLRTQVNMKELHDILAICRLEDCISQFQVHQRCIPRYHLLKPGSWHSESIMTEPVNRRWTLVEPSALTLSMFLEGQIGSDSSVVHASTDNGIGAIFRSQLLTVDEGYGESIWICKRDCFPTTRPNIFFNRTRRSRMCCSCLQIFE